MRGVVESWGPVTGDGQEMGRGISDGMSKGGMNGQEGQLGSGDMSMEMAMGWVEGRTVEHSRGHKWPHGPDGGDLGSPGG